MANAAPGPSATPDIPVDPWTALHHARAVYLLHEAGVDCLVLKGPSAHWLYPGGARRSCDADLLVSSADVARAVQAFVGSGYEEVHTGVRDGEVASHSRVLADTLVRRGEVDLHIGFPGIGVAPDEAWAALWERRAADELGGVPVWYLDRPAQILVLVLHAARNGSANARSVGDVRRLVALVDDDEWREVAALAARLAATTAFVAGLRLETDGALLADRLGLGRVADREWALRSASGSAPALRLLELSALPRRRIPGALLREAFPSPAFMRVGWPLARHGWLGLAAAYVQRACGLARRLPRAIRETRRATRTARLGQ